MYVCACALANGGKRGNSSGSHYQNEVILPIEELLVKNNGAVAIFRPFTVAGYVVKSIGVCTSFLL